MTLTRIPPPPKDLDSFLGRKWLETLTRQNEDLSSIVSLQFLLLAIDPALPNARKLTGSADVSLSDGGAGGNLIVGLTSTGVVAGVYTKVTVDAKGRVTSATLATTTDIAEGVNLYFTNARARSALSGTTDQINYNSSTGVISTPQNIATTSSPTFAGLTVDNLNGSVSAVSGVLSAGDVVIQQYDTDPASPAMETAWILKSGTGGSGGGEIKAFLGLGFPIIVPNSGGSTTYQFSYRTLEGTTVRATLA